jgi:hypothetical protein
MDKLSHLHQRGLPASVSQSGHANVAPSDSRSMTVTAMILDLKAFEQNVATDVRVSRAIEEKGWKVRIIWEYKTRDRGRRECDLESDLDNCPDRDQAFHI